MFDLDSPFFEDLSNMGQSSDFNSFLNNLYKGFSLPVPSIRSVNSLYLSKEQKEIETFRSSDFELDDSNYQTIFESLSDGIIIHDFEKDCIIDANPAAYLMYGYTRDEFLGLHPTKFIHSDSRTYFSECISDVHSGKVFRSLFVNLHRDGTSFYVDFHGKALRYKNRPCMLGVIHYIDDQIKSIEKHHKQTEARSYEQSFLLDFASKLASSLELDPGLILEQFKLIVPYTNAIIFRYKDEQLTTLAVSCLEKTRRKISHPIQLKNPETFELLFIGQPSIRIENINNSDPMASFVHTLLKEYPINLLQGIQSWMWVPMVLKGQLLGCFGFGHIDTDFFTSHHSELAIKAAEMTTTAFTNAELYAQAQSIASIQERRILARNLHDAVNQSLFSAGLIAEVLPHLWERDQEEGKRSLEDLRRLTRGAQAEIRMMLVDLRPSTLIDVEIHDLLHLLANAFSGRTNIPIDVTICNDCAMPSKVQAAFYHFCQEALNNIVKHAKATKVEIILQNDLGEMNLCVKDNGCGFDRRRQGLKRDDIAIDPNVRDKGQSFNPKYIPPGHYGLRMMDELAGSVGAELRIITQPGQGTSISIHWKEPPEKEVISS